MYYFIVDLKATCIYLYKVRLLIVQKSTDNAFSHFVSFNLERYQLIASVKALLSLCFNLNIESVMAQIK